MNFASFVLTDPSPRFFFQALQQVAMQCQLTSSLLYWTHHQPRLVLALSPQPCLTIMMTRTKPASAGHLRRMIWTMFRARRATTVSSAASGRRATTLAPCRARRGKSFFRRTIRKRHNYKCRMTHDCEINRETRNHCQYCRLQKCYRSGMKKARECHTETICKMYFVYKALQTFSFVECFLLMKFLVDDWCQNGNVHLRPCLLLKHSK